MAKQTLKICAISDVHCRWKNLNIPEVDILISSGDYSFKGEKHVVKEFHEWLNKQDAGYIISVQGNHELWVEKNFQEAKEIAEKACPGVHFLQHSPIEIEGIKIFGSAWTPWFYSWAWNARRTPEQALAFGGPFIGDLWKDIPDDTNILVTHGPPYGILDELVYPDGTPKGELVGCEELSKRISQLNQLDLHIFGHIHCGAGQKHLNGVSYYNASVCDEQYYPSNPITIIDYQKES